jgi:hypothetical protein
MIGFTVPFNKSFDAIGVGFYIITKKSILILQIYIRKLYMPNIFNIFFHIWEVLETVLIFQIALPRLPGGRLRAKYL